METDQVGDAGGKRGNLKESRLRDLHRLNSDKLMEWQDQLYIGIQEKNNSIKDVKHDGSDQLNRLGPVCVPNRYPSPYFLCFYFPLFPFSIFSYAHPLTPFVNMQMEWSHRVLIS
jgi:hypothetical protein